MNLQEVCISFSQFKGGYLLKSLFRFFQFCLNAFDLSCVSATFTLIKFYYIPFSTSSFIKYLYDIIIHMVEVNLTARFIG